MLFVEIREMLSVGAVKKEGAVFVVVRSGDRYRIERHGRHNAPSVAALLVTIAAMVEP